MKLPPEEFAESIINRMKKEDLIKNDNPDQQLVTLTYTSFRMIIEAALENYFKEFDSKERERACMIVQSYINYASSFEEEEMNEILNEILKKIQGKEIK